MGSIIPDSNKTQILLLFGGASSEHEVSIRSAKSILDAINRQKYTVELCYIDPQGRWWILQDWPADIKLHGGLSLSAELGRQMFVVPDLDKRIRPDVILPVLHGPGGEDGTVQGLAELMRIPIVGCDVSASILCWDKVLTKQILELNDIAVTPYKTHDSGAVTPDYDELLANFGNSFFVKPSRSGSSIGVSRVDSKEDYEVAVDLALAHDSKILIEKGVVGRELEVAVLGNPPDHQVSGVGEIVPGKEFYSYEDKYDEQSSAEVIVDADLDNETKETVRRIAHEAYASLGCRGLARIDFLLGQDGNLYVNEVNTFPGFTSISQYPKLWQAAGISYEHLIDELIESAIKRI